MKLYAPTYYNDFECKKENCKRNCCIGWEICIDEKTAEKYRVANGALWDSVREGLITSDDGSVSFRMKNGRCPNLRADGLCRIIAEAGEEMICDICKRHPRFYNRTSLGFEVGLGLACEAAAELIFSNDLEIECIGNGECDLPMPFIDIAYDREYAIRILSDTTLSYCDKLSELERYFGIEKKYKNIAEYVDLYLTLENLEPLWRVYLNGLELCKNPIFPQGREEENILSRLTAYFLYRYMPASEDKAHERAIVSLALHAPLMIYSVYVANKDKLTLSDAALIYSSEIEYSEENVERLISEFDTSFDF